MSREQAARKGWLGLFSRYAVVGVINTCIGLGLIYALMHLAGWDHFASTFVGNTIGVLCSYVLNRRFTFQYEGAQLSSFIRFLVISLLCYAAAYVLLHPAFSALVTGLLGSLPQSWQQSLIVLCEAGAYTVTSFVLHRLITFAAPSSASEPSSRVVRASDGQHGEDYDNYRSAERQ
ncbi:GtrA family protein [Paenibacillaceae sp. P-4]|uniref:GtrA family protein n=1 Tax=Paenibacillaceae bacterium P-4 TaxID=3160969 RepID=UPI0032E823D3